MWFLLFSPRDDGVLSVCRPSEWRRRMGVPRLCYRAVCALALPQPNNLHTKPPCTSRDGWLARKYAWAGRLARWWLCGNVECAGPVRAVEASIRGPAAPVCSQVQSNDARHAKSSAATLVSL